MNGVLMQGLQQPTDAARTGGLASLEENLVDLDEAKHPHRESKVPEPVPFQNIPNSKTLRTLQQKRNL